ncbi:putative AAA family ATPase [Martiniozyma asiatica (nom. inval.)]|nr:putative AAA family ATPase [Martiniozyma asiatica]
MAKKKIGVLQKDLDNKIYNLILNFLDDKTAELKSQLQEEEKETTFCMALARDLQFEEIMNYVRSKDLTLARTKSEFLSASIDRAWSDVKHEEEEEISNLPQEKQALLTKSYQEEEEEEEGDIDAQLMTVKDLNLANKSVVSLWNDKSSTEELTNTATTAASTNATTKKRKVKDISKISKKQKMDRSPPTIKLNSLGGLNEIIDELMEVVGLPILHPEIYLSTGIQPPRGVLLHGPPGCGKTSIANALAGELKVPFINISAPSVVSGMSGESEKKVRELFDEAKSLAPCLVFIDEIDAITPKRDGGAQREMERRIVAQLLTCMDELAFEKTGGKPVIVIGATNRPDSLDAALRRAGRFDREICINVPGEQARLNILQSMTKDLKVSGELELKELAKMTPGFVGADLKALVTAAGIAAIKRMFGSLTEIPAEFLEIASPVQKEDVMDVDEDINNVENNAKVESLEEENEQETTTTTTTIDEKDTDCSLSLIQKFLAKHPNPLTPSQLEPLSICNEDFVSALPDIQPTAKREGFATVPDVNWNNVGALSKIRVELHMAIVQPIKRPEIYEKVGITAPAGVLMWGPPGCGKTLLAKAVANESKANFISVKGPELLNKYVGESEKAVRQMFARARASVPCIIFFDELDALVPRRDTSLSESSSRVVNTLLTELDGLNNRKGIFVIGATNRPDMIDPAMLRPGRLDKTLYIELPNAIERFDILKTLIKSNGTPIDKDVNLEILSHDERCRNFSGADLSSLVREASVVALKRNFFKGISELDEEVEDSTVENVLVTAKDFERALDATKPSVSDRDRAKYEKLNKRLGWDKTSANTETQEKDTEAI